MEPDGEHDDYCGCPSEEVVMHTTREHIRRFGWTAIGVERDMDDGSPSFAYTVGLWESAGHAELLVVGLPAEAAHSVLSAAVTAIHDTGRMVPGTRRDDVLHGFDVLVHEIVPETCQVAFGVAVAHYGRSVPVVQLHWPDADGVMPSDADAGPSGLAQLID